MSPSTTENSSVDSRSSCTSRGCSQAGGRASGRPSPARAPACAAAAPAPGALPPGPPAPVPTARPGSGPRSVHIQAGLAHDLGHQIGLIPHQVRQQLGRRTEALAPAHMLAQPVQRAQRLVAQRDQQLAPRAHPQRGHLGRRALEIENHVVEHATSALLLLDARRMGRLAQHGDESVRQFQMRLQPAHTAGLGQVHVQPEEIALFRFVRAVRQPLCQRLQIEFGAGAVRREAEGADQARNVGFIACCRRCRHHDPRSWRSNGGPLRPALGSGW